MGASNAENVTVLYKKQILLSHLGFEVQRIVSIFHLKVSAIATLDEPEEFCNAL